MRQELPQEWSCVLSRGCLEAHCITGIFQLLQNWSHSQLFWGWRAYVKWTFRFPLYYLSLQISPLHSCLDNIVVTVVELLSHVPLSATPCTIACQAPLFIESSRQEYWSGVSFSAPEDLPAWGIESMSPALAGRFFTAAPSGKPNRTCLDDYWDQLPLSVTHQVWPKFFDNLCPISTNCDLEFCFLLWTSQVARNSFLVLSLLDTSFVVFPFMVLFPWVS